MIFEVSRPTNLPPLNHDEKYISDLALSEIKQKIKSSGGKISFSKFMHHALYAPLLGYYSGKSKKFGESGDFITAAEETGILGRIIAKQCSVILNEIPDAAIIEYGPGSGALAVSILKQLLQMGLKPRAYYMVDVSEDLIERQKNRISTELPEIYDSVIWKSEIPDGFSGIVIGNEVIDSMPFERFMISNKRILQFFVGTKEEELVYKLEPANIEIKKYVKRIESQIGKSLCEGYISEISFIGRDWINQISLKLNQGMIILLDYGVSRSEYYSDDKNQGWTHCHFKHHKHFEPLIYPGMQDITTWVDFSLISETAKANDMIVDAYLTQAQFIINNGIEDEFLGFESMDIKKQMELTRQIKLLTLPDKMGSNFKCLVMTKNFLKKGMVNQTGDKSYVL
ncbi:MAG: hypothetical protein CMP03_03045 [Woeseiaceae bacterium]|nr:hypothetical protein [Woeseiaceae bacterium]